MALALANPTNRPASDLGQSQGPTRRAFRVAAAFALLVSAGCQSSISPLARFRDRTGNDSYANGPPSPSSEEGGERGLLARWLTPSKTPHASEATTKTAGMVLGKDGWAPIKVKPNPEADAELAQAQQLVKDGKAADGESLLAKIAKKRKGTPWGEKAQFQLAESQYARGKLFNANDSYEQLIKDYPGTEYLDKLVSREYEIAKVWLAQYDPKAKPEALPSIADRFDGKFPSVDPGGHAIKALEHVRLHDPNGPLADDAVLKVAEYYQQVGNHELAAVYYDQLVSDHPKSPYLHQAQLAGIDEKLKAYYGPKYNGRNLEAARDSIKQTMASFPERFQTNEKLHHTLDVIDDQEAERAYEVGVYYKSTGKVSSAEYYFGMVIAKWPKNEWAKKAKVEMASLAKMERKKWVPSTIMATPGGADPFAAGQGASGMGPNGIPNSY